MQKKNTKLEKGLRVSGIILFVCGFLLIGIPFSKEIKQYYQVVMSLGLFIAALDFTSKVFRFYKQANKIINTIWCVSIILILLGSTMWFPDWSIGIGCVGIVAFNFTLGYSFFANKPEIR